MSVDHQQRRRDTIEVSFRNFEEIRFGTKSLEVRDRLRLTD